MNRIVLAVTGVGCLAVGTVPSLASSAPVDHGRIAATLLSVTQPDGRTLSLDVRGMVGADGPVLLVSEDQCDGDACTETDYASPIPDSALSVDPSNPVADLHATLAGAPVVISWRPPAQAGYVIAGGHITGGGAGVTSAQYTGSSADVDVRFGDSSCAGTGAVGDGLLVDTGATTGDATFEPVSALHLPAGSVVRCTS